MHRPIMSRLTPLLFLAGFVPLAGCISLSPKPPAMLLTLDSTAAPAIGTVADSAQAHTITVLVPSVPAAIAGARVPVY